MQEKISYNNFIQKASQTHNNKYDYSKVIYKGTMQKVEILCPKHGSFWQCLDNHINGKQGCRKCYNERKKDKSTLCPTKEDFIQQAQKIHNNFYVYKKVIYKNLKELIIITCPLHGDFKQKAIHHLRGSGCSKCAKIKASNNRKDLRKRRTTEEFIQEAKKIHGEEYNYSKVKYINSTTKVEIICSKHGSFWQSPNAHFLGAGKGGYGCPKCKESKGEKKIAKYLQENNIQFEQQKRFKECRNINPLPFDFYIKAKNLLIEFQGIYHFKNMRPNSSYDLNYVLKNDLIKKQWALNNGHQFLEIKYDDEDWKKKIEALIK